MSEASRREAERPKPLLQVRLSAGYGSQAVLRDVAFEIGAGERLGLVGASGTGKSTLLLALLGLLPWQGGWARGEVLLEGRDLLTMSERELRSLRGRRIALVPQSPLTALNAEVSLETHFREAWRAHADRPGAVFQQRLEELLHQVRLPSGREFLRRKPGEVSVGQAQRVTLAMALLHRPALLVADEPTSALDACTQREVLSMLTEVSRAGETAVLLISHDLLSVIRFCGRVGVLADGCLVEQVAVSALPVGTHHPATEALLRTLPVAVGTLLENLLTI